MNKASEARFWAKVEKTSSCWLWTASTGPRGYGQFALILESGRKTMVRAHRVSWELANGAVPEGVCVLHRCDIRRCVNPAHLFLGTQFENSRDMIRKGRSPRGERSGAAILTEPEVRAIRELARSGMRQREIAATYGVTREAVSSIVRNRSWSHVE